MAKVGDKNNFYYLKKNELKKILQWNVCTFDLVLEMVQVSG